MIPWETPWDLGGYGRDGTLLPMRDCLEETLQRPQGPGMPQQSEATRRARSFRMAPNPLTPPSGNSEEVEPPVRGAQ
jgi:hypothetical protein